MSSKNLYSDGFILDYGDGDISLERTPKTYAPVSTDKVHTVVDGETLMALASYFYGDELQWWKIAEANDLDEEIFDLPLGTILIIPNPDFF
jgi:nucleoid-associated protein YgaU